MIYYYKQVSIGRLREIVIGFEFHQNRLSGLGYGSKFDAAWRMRLNRASAAAMPSYVKLL